MSTTHDQAHEVDDREGLDSDYLAAKLLLDTMVQLPALPSDTWPTPIENPHQMPSGVMIHLFPKDTDPPLVNVQYGWRARIDPYAFTDEPGHGYAGHVAFDRITGSSADREINTVSYEIKRGGPGTTAPDKPELYVVKTTNQTWPGRPIDPEAFDARLRRNRAAEAVGASIPDPAEIEEVVRFINPQSVYSS